MQTKALSLCFIIALALTVGVVVAQEQTAPAAPASSGLADNLATKLGIKPEQAKGAAGAVFALAKSKLSTEDFTKLASGYPEMETLLKAAPAASSTGISATLANQAGGAAALLSKFNSLGIPADAAAKIVPEVLSFVKAKQGDAMMGLLAKAVQ